MARTYALLVSLVVLGGVSSVAHAESKFHPLDGCAISNAYDVKLNDWVGAPDDVATRTNVAEELVAVYGGTLGSVLNFIPWFQVVEIDEGAARAMSEDARVSRVDGIPIAFTADLSLPPFDCYDTVPAATGRGTVTVGAFDFCLLEESSVAALPEGFLPADPNFDFPLGLVEFRLFGCSTGKVKITYSGVTNLSGYTYRKYGPTPEDPSPHWYDFMYDPESRTGAQIEGNVVWLSFVDGERGDDDLTVNGSIVDQGGPGAREAVAAPALTGWGMLAFIIMAGLGSMLVIQRQGKHAN